MQFGDECVGFADYGGHGDVISQILESLYLPDMRGSEVAGVMRLCTVDESISDTKIIDCADSTPKGQLLWVFSSTSRTIRHDRLKLQHVPAESSREFILKTGRHIEKFMAAQIPGTALHPLSPPFPEGLREYTGAEGYVPVVGEKHVVRVVRDGVAFEMLSDLRVGAKHLVVFGQDALDRSKVELPKFFRWTWADELDCSTLVLNDPTLYLSETLDAGWWVGVRGRDYLREATELIQCAARMNGIRPANILFVGASAGGFSALGMAAIVAGSRALVDIPQTDLRNYRPADRANRAVEAGLGYKSTMDVPRRFLHRIDVLERFDYEGCLPQFSYFQNLKDETHVGPHFESFRERLGFTPPGSRFETYTAWHPKKRGHFPLARNRLLEEIRMDLSRMAKPTL